MRIALFQPDIALNVGAVARTAACLNCPVDIIGPCGFPFSLKALRRSGMDYLQTAQLTSHVSWDAYRTTHAKAQIVLFTTKATQSAIDYSFQTNNILLFGRESAGAPPEVHAAVGARVRLPMQAQTRSLNLSISVAMGLTLAYQKCGLWHRLEGQA
ncbi:MAG: TrmH family RNA methyltransferase [Pseudomonadota bacterium]